MGKKSRKQAAAAAEKPRLGKSLIDKATCRLVDELCEKTTRRRENSAHLSIQSLWGDYESIIGLVKTIQQRQGASPAPLPARKDGVAAFQHWAREQGVQCDSVEVSEFPVVGYGLRVTRMVEEGERVLVVPHSAMMTVQSARDGPLKSFISQQLLLNAMPNLALAIHLLNERYTNDSKWKPYINILPHTFCLPLYFMKEELVELQSSPVLFEALSQIKNIARLYSILHRELRMLADSSIALCSVGFHYDDFVWAVSSVMSRVNKVPIIDTNEYTLSLVPYWDMANHTTGTILTDYDPESSSLHCYSIARYVAGDEFKIFYGPRSNADLLLNSGFVYADNQHDTVKIKLGLSTAEEEVTQTMRSQLLQTLNLKLSTQYTVCFAETCFPPELQAFARVFTATPDQLKHWVRLAPVELRDKLFSLKWTSEDTQALQFLRTRCSLLLRTYKTTAEEDDVLLATPGLSNCHREVVKLRLCEKRLLQAASQQAKEEENKLAKGEVATSEEGQILKLEKQDIQKAKEDRNVDGGTSDAHRNSK